MYTFIYVFIRTSSGHSVSLLNQSTSPAVQEQKIHADAGKMFSKPKSLFYYDGITSIS